MIEYIQRALDISMRTPLIDVTEYTNNKGVTMRTWRFDTTIIYGDYTVINLPACFDELTAREHLVRYIQDIGVL